MQPQIILLREGTDTSQGKGQLLHNISACHAVVDAVRSTLGPRGMDKIIINDKGKNDHPKETTKYNTDTSGANGITSLIRQLLV
jgi:hypothetical protein